MLSSKNPIEEEAKRPLCMPAENPEVLCTRAMPMGYYTDQQSWNLSWA